VILGADLHRDFDGSKLLVPAAYNRDPGDVPDIDAAQAYGSTHAQTFCVIEVGYGRDSLGEESSGSGHQEKQNAQR